MCFHQLGNIKHILLRIILQTYSSVKKLNEKCIYCNITEWDLYKLTQLWFVEEFAYDKSTKLYVFNEVKITGPSPL
jgi:hypothetical protein